MALTFNGTSSKLQWSGAIATNFPLSMFCWVKPTSAAAGEMAFGAGKNGGANEFDIYLDGAGSGKVRGFENAGGSVAATSTSSISTAWTPALAVFTNASSRTIYYGAGAAVTDTSTCGGFSVAPDRVIVGMRAISDTLPFSGDIACAGIWSAALTQGDYDALAAGAVPSTIAAGSLIDYWSLLTQAATQTGVNGRVLTATSTAQASGHPITEGSSNASASGGTGTGTGSGSGGTATGGSGGAGSAAGGTGTSTGSGSGGTATGAGSGTFATDPMENNSGAGLLASTAVVWTWYQGAIGAAPTSTTHGTGTTNSSGVLTASGLPTGAGFLLVRTTDSAGVYYQPGTVS